MKWNQVKSKGGMLVTLALLVAFSATACSTSNTPKSTTAPQSTADAKPAGDAKTYKLSLSHALSGSSGGNGLSSQRGADIAAEEVNKAGGINGVKLEIISDDNRNDPAEATAIAKRRYDDVMASSNGSSGTLLLALMPLAKEKNIAFFAPGIATQGITNQGYSNVFRMHINDKSAAAAMATYLAKDMNFKKIAIIHDLNDYGVGGKDVIVKTLDGLGLKPVAVESFKGGDVDFTSQVMKAKQGDAEAIVIWGLGGEPSLIAKQIRSLNMKAQIAGGGGMDNRLVFVTPAGEAANDVLFVGWQLLSDNPKAKAFDDAYQAKYKAKAEILSYQNYDWVMICAEALKISGNDRVKFLEAVRTVSKTYKGFYGTYNFDSNGDNAISVEILKWKNAERLPIKSFDVSK